MIPPKCVVLAPVSRNIQHFDRLVDRIICMFSFKYMLRIFRILLFISPNGSLYRTIKVHLI
jgi:hypothetical protein